VRDRDKMRRIFSSLDPAHSLQDCELQKRSKPTSQSREQGKQERNCGTGNSGQNALRQNRARGVNMNRFGRWGRFSLSPNPSVMLLMVAVILETLCWNPLAAATRQILKGALAGGSKPPLASSVPDVHSSRSGFRSSDQLPGLLSDSPDSPEEPAVFSDHQQQQHRPLRASRTHCLPLPPKMTPSKLWQSLLDRIALRKKSRGGHGFFGRSRSGSEDDSSRSRSVPLAARNYRSSTFWGSSPAEPAPSTRSAHAA